MSNTGTLGITISGFDQGSEKIDLTGIGNDGMVGYFDTVTNLLTVTGSGGSVMLHLDGTDGSHFTTAADGIGTDLMPASGAAR